MFATTIPPTHPLRVAIITGSTRRGRHGDAVARWVHGIAARTELAEFALVDIADYALPHLDEALPALAGRYEPAHTRTWAERIGSFDAFAFVTPDYVRALALAAPRA